ncbi:MAG: hypothetical protein HC834_04350 [Rhodospirillales bacterium]|nr:hypothetical protein [Rhodospirillales bacterium]
MSDAKSVNEIAGAYWDNKIQDAQKKEAKRIRWWDDKTTTRHINKIIDGSDSDALHEAFHRRISGFFQI